MLYRFNYVKYIISFLLTFIFIININMTYAASTLVVVNKSSNTISLFDEQQGKLMKEIAVGFKPHEAALSPNKKFIVVANYGSQFKPGSTISVIEFNAATTQTSTRTIVLPARSRPHGLKFISDDEVLVVAEGIQSLLGVDIVTGNLERRIPLPGKGAHMLAVDQSKHFAYVASMNSGTVCKIDLNKNQVVNDTQIGRHAEGLVLLQDEQSLLVANRKDNEIAQLSTHHLEILKKVKTERGPIRIALVNEGKQAAISNCIHGTIQVLDLNTMKISQGYKATRLYSRKNGKIFGKLLSVPISIAPREDGHTAYIANSFAGNITLMELTNGAILKTFEAAKEPDGLVLG